MPNVLPCLEDGVASAIAKTHCGSIRARGRRGTRRSRNKERPAPLPNVPRTAGLEQPRKHVFPILFVAALFVTATARAANPNSPTSTPDLTSKGSTQQATAKDGQCTDKDGNPTYHVGQDGKTVDWHTMSGSLRSNSACLVCHCLDGVGPTYALSLVEALKTMDYAQFAGIIVGGKHDVNASKQLVMPAFADNKNVMCFMPDIYTFLRVRADRAVGRKRIEEHEPKPDAHVMAEDACMK